jgi:tripartite-type tricarboxylate transporter receptor subunit TctC
MEHNKRRFVRNPSLWVAGILLLAACGGEAADDSAQEPEPTGDGQTATAQPEPDEPAEPTGEDAQDGDAADDEVAEFYRSNPVTVIANSRPGGLTDAFARMIQPYWEELTGGTMRIENDEGGGGLTGINRVYGDAGNAQLIGAGILGAHFIAFDLFEAEGAVFDARELAYVASFPPELGTLAVAVGANNDYETLEDLQSADVVNFGATHPDSGASHGVSIATEILGIEARILTGYRGGDIAVAAAGGEFDAYAWTGTGAVQHVADGLVKEPFAVVGRVRSPLFPDTPALPEVAELTPEQEELLELTEAINVMTGFAMPPGVDDAYVTYMRDTFVEAMQAEGFIADAEALWTAWADPMSGEDTQAFVNDVLDVSPDLVAALREMTQSRLPQ